MVGAQLTQFKRGLHSEGLNSVLENSSPSRHNLSGASPLQQSHEFTQNKGRKPGSFTCRSHPPEGRDDLADAQRADRTLLCTSSFTKVLLTSIQADESNTSWFAPKREDVPDAGLWPTFKGEAGLTDPHTPPPPPPRCLQVGSFLRL